MLTTTHLHTTLIDDGQLCTRLCREQKRHGESGYHGENGHDRPIREQRASSGLSSTLLVRNTQGVAEIAQCSLCRNCASLFHRLFVQRAGHERNLQQAQAHEGDDMLNQPAAGKLFGSWLPGRARRLLAAAQCTCQGPSQSVAGCSRLTTEWLAHLRAHDVRLLADALLVARLG